MLKRLFFLSVWHYLITFDTFLQVLAMCFIRKGLDWVFTQEELRWLDDVMPEIHNRAKEDKEKEKVKNSLK